MKDFFKESFIEYFAVVPLSRCKVIKEYLLTKNGFDSRANVITMLIPYRSDKAPLNLSVYASVKDYHLFVDELSVKLDEYMREKHPGAKYKLFADHSPIDEVHATCISGLGFIGDNGLLINEKYSSFVFLAECITDLSCEELNMAYADVSEVKECLHCGACARACPSGCIPTAENKDSFNPKTMCLSAVTQKKGELAPHEQQMMLDCNTVWGCDICQNACPYTKNAKHTPIPFFNSDIITYLDKNALSLLDEESFKRRPFAWRGRAVIERNVTLFEERK